MGLAEARLPCELEVAPGVEAGAADGVFDEPACAIFLTASVSPISTADLLLNGCLWRDCMPWAAHGLRRGKTQAELGPDRPAHYSLR